jgi:hypothetical protein
LDEIEICIKELRTAQSLLSKESKLKFSNSSLSHGKMFELSFLYLPVKKLLENENKNKLQCSAEGIYVFMYLCNYVSMHLNIYLSMYLCIYVSMCLCVYVSIIDCNYLCNYLSMYLSMYVCIYRMYGS